MNNGCIIAGPDKASLCAGNNKKYYLYDQMFAITDRSSIQHLTIQIMALVATMSLSMPKLKMKTARRPPLLTAREISSGLLILVMSILGLIINFMMAKERRSRLRVITHSHRSAGTWTGGRWFPTLTTMKDRVMR